MSEFRSIDVGDREPIIPADPGAAPMLQWVKIASLVIDESYQRDIGKSNWAHIHKIAKNFSWSKFSPVFAAPVTGGRYAVIDGQHRTHAAALCGFEEVPAQIVQMSKPQQAAAFAAVNGGTIRVTPYQLFRSALEAEELWAVSARDAVAAAGCVLMDAFRTADARQPGEVYAFREIRRQVDAGRGASVTVALAALRLSEAGKDPASWADELLRPWLVAVCDRPHLADAGRLSAVFDSFDCYAALDGVVAFKRAKLRVGIPTPPRHELMAAEFGTAIDARLVQSKMRAAG